MDATHFRQRAARARELAQSGDDVCLSRMLLDVAVDLDAEAEAIEAEIAQKQDSFGHRRRAGLSEVLLSITGLDGEAR